MLINQKDSNITPHVEFISYTGKWPSLCCGILTLEIDGKEVKFGDSDKLDMAGPKFWRSGGSCSLASMTSNEWIIDMEVLPEEYHPYALEIDKVMNANMEHGCCGGCR